MSDVNADLMRRVLAHEQILQALVAYMVESDVGMLDRLREAFSQPVHLGPEGFDDTATYAARFVRDVIRTGVHTGGEDAKPGPSLVSLWDDLWPTLGEGQLLNGHVPVRFEIQKRDDMWEVLRDGRLCGGYISQEGALESAQIAIHDIFCTGGSAELVASQKAVS